MHDLNCFSDEQDDNCDTYHCGRCQQDYNSIGLFILHKESVEHKLRNVISLETKSFTESKHDMVRIVFVHETFTDRLKILKEIGHFYAGIAWAKSTQRNQNEIVEIVDLYFKLHTSIFFSKS